MGKQPLREKIKDNIEVLISAYNKETIGKTSGQLSKKLEAIQKESSAAYQKQIVVFSVTTLLAFLLLMFMMLFSAAGMGKRIVDPLNIITERISKLEGSDLEFKMEDEYRTGDEEYKGQPE